MSISFIYPPLIVKILATFIVLVTSMNIVVGYLILVYLNSPPLHLPRRRRLLQHAHLSTQSRRVRPNASVDPYLRQFKVT